MEANPYQSPAIVEESAGRRVLGALWAKLAVAFVALQFVWIVAFMLGVVWFLVQNYFGFPNPGR